MPNLLSIFDTNDAEIRRVANDDKRHRFVTEMQEGVLRACLTNFGKSEIPPAVADELALEFAFLPSLFTSIDKPVLHALAVAMLDNFSSHMSKPESKATSAHLSVS